MYTAFGMQISSEVRLLLPVWNPACIVPEASSDTSAWHVDIVYGKIPRDFELPHAIGAIRYGMGNGIGIDSKWIGVDVPSVARYQIEGISRIVVEPAPGADEKRIALFICGLILAFLLKQRPIITLHGSAVVGGGGALVFIGAQGSGKSTMAALLTSAGYRILCDDIIPIADGPVVLPGVSHVKLLPDAFELLVGNPDEAAHLFDGVDKFHADLGGTTCAAPLCAIFVLEPADVYAQGVGQLLVEPITGMKKIRALLQHVSSIKGLDDGAEQFLRLTKRLSSVPVYRVVRPACGCDRVELISRIIKTGAIEEVCDEIC